jgi:hypothetical protein
VNYAKLLEIKSFLTWHIFLEVGKIQDLPNKFGKLLEMLQFRVLLFLPNTSSFESSIKIKVTHKKKN